MLESLHKQRSGPLTLDLAQAPGQFGLGKVPARLKPVSTVTSICGYCATGCQLNIHLDAQGNAINLTPAHGHPVNLGMACPKGRQALDLVDAPDRATTPLLRDTSGGLKPVPWDTALDVFVSRFRTIRVETIEALARTVSEPGKRVSWWWTMGINQSYEGVRAAQAMINLALITGNIGKPGTGANSITGQCNAMGSRLFSNTTSLVGGHDFADAAHREKVAAG